MAYSLASDARELLSLLTEDVIADTAVGSLSIERCRVTADAAIDEAARAGNYDAPFQVTSTASGSHATLNWVRDASAVGAVSYARRGLELAHADKESAAALLFEREFEARLDRLRKGEVDLGTLVHSQSLTIPDELYTWAGLNKGGIAQGSVRLTDEGGQVAFVEDRSVYEELYRLGVPKDYEVDHVRGRVRALVGGRIAPGSAVEVSFTYFVKQPPIPDEEQAKSRSVQLGSVRRSDVVAGPRGDWEEDRTLGP